MLGEPSRIQPAENQGHPQTVPEGYKDSLSLAQSGAKSLAKSRHGFSHDTTHSSSCSEAVLCCEGPELPTF